ncbi:relaxin receptor-like protein [Plakobranchus ocellatus]|uniref:Relaxin receptor-like protein n=1 Tax=Plakobranchus ocellatus TaxID=259542 RepID=A0AAV3XWS6_9GAST|nr:relaxin receptor-like protein [Plakobranchus ocellatus]
MCDGKLEFSAEMPQTTYTEKYTAVNMGSVGDSAFVAIKTFTCAGINVIFVFDEMQPDSRTYYTNIDFAHYLVKEMDDNANLTLLTFNASKSTDPKGKFGVVFHSTKKAYVSSSMWYRRFKSKWAMQDLVDLCNEAEYQVVVMCVNLRHSSFFETLLQELKFRERIITPVPTQRTHSHLKLKFYDLRYNSMKQGSDDENIGDYETSTYIRYVSKRHRAQHTVTVYRNAEKFQDSFQFLRNDVCRFSQFFQLQAGLCPPQYNCSGYVEFNINRIDFSVKSSKNNWKHVVLLKPYTDVKQVIEQVDWGRAKKVCSQHGMIPLVIQSATEVNIISQSIITYSSILTQFIVNAYGHDITEINMMIGLRRSRDSVGRRFSWGKYKDLLYSHWGPGQPSDISNKECVHWKFNRSNTRVKFVDQGWFTSTCGEKSASVTLCELNVLLSNKVQLLSMIEEEVDMPGIFKKGAFGAVKGRQTEGTIFLAMSSMAALAFKVFYELMDYNKMNISRTILGESGIMSRTEIELLFEHLHSLYYPCSSKGSYNPFIPRVIPFSQVCDGAVDCPTGNDEESCSGFKDIFCSPTQFSCKSGQCVSLEAKCDLMKDCQDGSDEEDCDLDCPHMQCPSGRCLPNSWFSDGQEDCDDGFDEQSNSLSMDTCVFICNRSKCVTRTMLNDSVIDCKGPEGPLDETLGALESMNCTQTGAITLINNWAPKCVLVRDNFGEVIGCRDYQHLAGCLGFACPKNFVKCPKSFCIPLSYVNDGKQDCDDGEDEGKFLEINVTNLFKCNVWSSQCVPLSAICDGKTDCALGEDELECGIHCSPGFICLSAAVKAVRISEIFTPEQLSFIDGNTRYLDLSTVSIPNFFHIYPRGRLHYLLTLNLSRCDMITVTYYKSTSPSKSGKTSYGEQTMYKDFSVIQNIDLSHNQFKEIGRHSFLDMTHHLRILNLSHNFQLSHISQESFTGLTTLEVLDLSFTGITFLRKRTFEFLINLSKLSLKGTGLTAINFIFPQNIQYLNFEDAKVSDISENAFSKVRSLRQLLSPNYKLCCPAVLGAHIQSHTCHFSESSKHSCNDLIEEPGLRVLLWLVCSATLIGNIITLVYRLTWDKAIVCKPYGLFVTNLGISDLMMGIYLVIISVADTIYKDMYVLHDFKWRHSQACWIAGSIGTLSSITSTVFIALITADRFLAVQYPYGEVRFTAKTMVTAVVVTWVCGAVAAFLPMIPLAQDWVIFSNSGMCLGLPFNEKRPPGWQYSAVMFVTVNLILFIFIVLGQYRIFKLFKEKRKRTRNRVNPRNQLSKNQRTQEIAIAKQLSLIVISNFICWFPVITMGILTLSGIAVGQSAYRWSATLILPINSALNPVLYTLPAVKKKWDDFRDLKRKAQKARETRASVQLAQQESTAGKKPDTKRMLLMKSCRSVKTVRLVVSLKAEKGAFTESDLISLYKKVNQHLLGYR